MAGFKIRRYPGSLFYKISILCLFSIGYRPNDPKDRGNILASKVNISKHYSELMRVYPPLGFWGSSSRTS